MRALSAELERARRVAIEALVDHFARDHLRPEEFERRVAVARAATTAGELRALLGDLPGRGDPSARDLRAEDTAAG